MSQIPITATQLASSAHVSKETGNQLALVTDPYHDYPITATGFPDGKSVYSVVKRRNGRTTIICPFTLSSNQSWDFHVFTTPLHDYTTLKTGWYTDGMLSDNATGNMVIGPVNVLCKHYDAAGVVINVLLIPFPATAPVTVASSQCRTVSLGFEIHDASPTLESQGTISSYRVNEPPLSVYGIFQGTPSLSYPHDYVGSVPTDLGAIMINPTNKTWELKHGVYSVALPAHTNSYHLGARSSIVIPLPLIPITFNCVYLNTVTTGNTVSWSPLLCSGSASSRLTSSALSYVVDYRQIVELMPSPSSDLMQYATTSPVYNNQFMKMYKTMVFTIPCATKVGNNASGDWFRAIAGLARTVAPMVMSVLPPQARALATLAAPIANYGLTKLEDKMNNRSNKKPTGDKPPPKKNG